MLTLINKKVGVAVLISGRARKVIRDKEGHYIMIKRILQEDITILNMHVPNNRVSNYTRQKLIELQEEIVDSNIIDGAFDTPP